MPGSLYILDINRRKILKGLKNSAIKYIGSLYSLHFALDVTRQMQICNILCNFVCVVLLINKRKFIKNGLTN